MASLKNFSYYKNNKKINIKVKVCDTIWLKFSGLMFRKKSYPLLFPFNKEKKLSIHSFFCVPFKAIWLDGKKEITKEIDIKKWRLNFSGKGKYLLEIPLSSENLITKK